MRFYFNGSCSHDSPLEAVPRRSKTTRADTFRRPS